MTVGFTVLDKAILDAAFVHVIVSFMDLFIHWIYAATLLLICISKKKIIQISSWISSRVILCIMLFTHKLSVS